MLKDTNTPFPRGHLCLLTKKEEANRERELRAYTWRGRRNASFLGTRSEIEGLREKKIENRVLPRRVSMEEERCDCEVLGKLQSVPDG